MKPTMPELPIRGHHLLPDPEAVKWDGEQRCENCAPGYDCERGIYTPDTARIIGEGTKP